MHCVGVNCKQYVHQLEIKVLDIVDAGVTMNLKSDH